MKKKILITAKTYPSISRSHTETVCIAGLELDHENKPLNWIRIYPLAYRYLDYTKRFKTFSIIEVDLERDTRDKRGESYKIQNYDYSILEEQVPTNKNWDRRKKIVLPVLRKSIEEIKSTGESLGIIKPAEGITPYWKTDEKEWSDSKKATHDQTNLFIKKKKLDKIPYKFGYKFKCDDPECKTMHNLSIIDWGTLELYRRELERSPNKDPQSAEKFAIDQVIKKLEKFTKDNDLYLIVGNQRRRYHIFMIIGLFYPKKEI